MLAPCGSEKVVFCFPHKNHLDYLEQVLILSVFCVSLQQWISYFRGSPFIFLASNCSVERHHLCQYLGTKNNQQSIETSCSYDINQATKFSASAPNRQPWPLLHLRTQFSICKATKIPISRLYQYSSICAKLTVEWQWIKCLGKCASGHGHLDNFNWTVGRAQKTQ